MGLRFCERTGYISTGNFSPQRKTCIALTFKRTHATLYARIGKIFSEFNSIDEKIVLNIVQTWGNIEIGSIYKRTNIKTCFWGIFLYEFNNFLGNRERRKRMPEKFCSLSKSLCVIFETKEKNFIFIFWIH